MRLVHNCTACCQENQVAIEDAVQKNEKDDAITIDELKKLRGLITGLREDLTLSAECAKCGTWFDPETRECDDNECADRSHKCSEFAICTDTLGGYNCTCKPGYIGDGNTCEASPTCLKGVPGYTVTKCSGKHEICLATQDQKDTDPICGCEPGFKYEDEKCVPYTVNQFQHAVTHIYGSQYFQEGSVGFAINKPGDTFTETFWIDECEDGNEDIGLKHPIHCKNQPKIAPEICHDGGFVDDDTHHESNWFEFWLRQPVMVSKWRIRARRHSAEQYLGEVRIEALNHATNQWVRLDSRDNSEPGRCKWTETRDINNGFKSRFYRMSVGNNNRKAYQSFAALEFTITDTAYHYSPTIENNVARVTYSDTIDNVNELSSVGSNLFNDECECSQIYDSTAERGSNSLYSNCFGDNDEKSTCCPEFTGEVALVAKDQVFTYGQVWTAIELKIPTRVLGFRIKGRNIANAKTYMGDVDLLASSDGKNWKSVLDSGVAYSPNGCQMGPYISANDKNDYKFFKLEFWGNAVKGQESFSQLLLYTEHISLGLEVGLIDYFTFEKTYKSVYGRKSEADISITSAGKPMIGCNDFRDNGYGGFYTHRLEVSERVGKFAECANQDGQTHYSNDGLWKGGWAFMMDDIRTTFSVGFLFKLNDGTIHNPSDGAGIFFADGATWTGGALLSIAGSGNTLYLYSPTPEGIATSYNFELGKWVNLVLTVEDGKTAIVYANGEVVGRDTQHTNYKLAKTNYFCYYDGNKNNHFARGSLDELAYWDRPLTPGEVN